MNQRINELAEQAGYTEAYYESDHGPFIPAEFNKQKFAELIVLECMAIGFNTVYKVDDDSAAVAVYQNIKEHFGVDE